MRNALPISWVHIGGFYDHPIDGWCRMGARNHFHFFNLSNPDAEIDEALIYQVYSVPKEQALPHVLLIRAFRHMVGWHCDHAPGQPRGCFDADGHPNWRDFYNLPKPPPVDLAMCEMVGTTRDLRTVERVINALCE